MAENGRSSETQEREKVPASIIQAALLAEIETGIRELIELVNLQLPVGLTPFIGLTVDTDLEEIRLEPPWFSVHILNDGDFTLLVTVNDEHAAPVEIRAGEDERFDFQKPAIHGIGLRAQRETVPVRLIGTR